MKLFFLFLFSLLVLSVNAQNLQKPSSFEVNKAPIWAQKMYAENPNVFEVDFLYQNYYAKNVFVKSYHTQYYKRWRKKISKQINEAGFINPEIVTTSKKEKPAFLPNKTTGWSVIGPIENHQENAQQGSGQANIYCIDQCKTNESILYCGTEPGEVYKSTDGANTWTSVSMNEDFGSGVTAVEVSPTNPNFVFAGGNNGIFKSTDGALAWTNTLPSSNLGVNEILISSSNESLVFAATDKGFYRSEDGGNSWSQMFTMKSYDVKENTANSNILYLLKNNPSQVKCEFFISTDFGLTWNLQNNGWYNSNDPNRNDGGARLATTLADPNRIYAYLIGEAKADDAGFIGVYKSEDGGLTWTLPNSPTGGPYSDTHPNLAIGSPDWIYHQGFYNCAILCSETNPDEIIVGGLNIWKSVDGGLTFSGVSGYIGGPLNLHVDNQDFRVINGNYWWSTDGGIYHSSNLLETQPDFKMKGVHASDYWGFGAGWNKDVLVGGLYHNGNLAYHENYGAGNFLELGGGEAPTGYVNPGNNLKTYFSDIGGKILPSNLNGTIESFGIGLTPNESYWAAESSEMEFHPNCYQISYVGKDNKLWKSEDAGVSYSLVNEFGTNPEDQVKYIEIGSDNPNIIYLNQQPLAGGNGTLWKTIDGGSNWTSLSLPVGNNRRMLLSINPSNSNEIWLAYPDGSNGNKVFQSVNGGQTWVNNTSTILNNQSPQAIQYIAGTNGGIYLGTNQSVFYRNNTMDWQIDNANLPAYTNVNILKPFYRDGKIRLASYGKGIWEGNLFEQPTLPIARIMVDKLQQNVYCAIDSFYFEDHSFLNHQNASWEWNFPTGFPTSSNLRNPSVSFPQEGNHLAILKITDAQGNSAIDSLTVSVDFLALPSIVEEGFEAGFLPEFWTQSSESGAGVWTQDLTIGGFGASSKTAKFDNFNTDSQGKKSDLLTYFEFGNAANAYLKFDVAYAQYDQTYSDSLEVLISENCGETFTSYYLKGGTDLSTAPNLQEEFIPTAAQWRTDSIEMNNLNGNLLLSFRNIGRYGNVIYLDNIQLTNNLKITKIKQNENLHFYPTIACPSEWITVNTNETEAFKIELFDMKGKIVFRTTSSHENGFYLPVNLKPSTYICHVETKNHRWNKKLVIK